MIRLTRYRTDFARKHYCRGVADGIIRILVRRGVEVSDVALDEIRACGDEDRLEEWLARAVTAKSLSELGLTT
ncbi:hypothetical protein ACFOVU_02700 [Nocardiopsis sediminis]|uniref:Transposase n=1 Tax=Nocardiopsis sediminis TaxID=1778267 RepID=A0ABV8FFA1_9ACTN